MKNYIKIYIVLFAIIFVTSSCQLQKSETQSSKIKLVLEIESNTRTVLPQEPDVEEYILSGNRNNGLIEELKRFTTPYDIQLLLEPGLWDFNLIAKNSAGDTILSDTLLEVNLTEAQTLPFVLIPQDAGEGSLDITLTWPDSITSVAFVIPTFSGDTGAELVIESVLGSNQVVFHKDNILKGNYIVNINMLNSEGTSILTNSELVRILPYLESSKIIELEVTDFNTVPEVPGSLSGRVTDESSSLDNLECDIDLIWTDESRIETGFELTWSIDDGVNWTTYPNQILPGVESLTLTGTRGETFLYRVRAINTFGPSDWSDAISITVLSLMSTLTPVQGTIFSETTSTLEWAAVDGAIKYEVQLAETEAGVTGATAVEVLTNLYTPETAPENYWFWRVRAIGLNNQTGAWSSISSHIVSWSSLIPETFDLSVDGLTTDSTPVLSWDEAFSNKYELIFADSELGLDSGPVIELTENSYTIPAPRDNNTFTHWKIRAFNAGDQPTDWSSVKSFQVSWGSTGPADGICFPSELVELAERGDLGGTYILGADIDLTGVDWLPIGTSSSNKFTGVFDGAGYTISNMTIDTTADYQGFFGYISNATISNLNIIDANINSTMGVSETGRDYIGILFGYSVSSSGTPSIIEDCNTSGIIKGSANVGGLIGYSLYDDISNCSSSATVSGTGNYTGGVIGYIYHSDIIHSFATGSVTGIDYVGGFIGNSNRSNIDQNWASGDITGESRVGGFFGSGDSYVTSTNCYATGAVVGTGLYIGAFAGTTDQSKYSFSIGATSNNGSERGFDGQSTTANAYNFYDSETTGKTGNSGASGISTSLMKTRTTFTDAGWDFEGESTNGTGDVWSMDSDTGTINNGYPYLINNPPVAP